jgi:hypothetical protein
VALRIIDHVRIVPAEISFALPDGFALIDGCTLLPHGEPVILKGYMNNIGLDAANPVAAELGQSV